MAGFLPLFLLSRSQFTALYVTVGRIASLLCCAALRRNDLFGWRGRGRGGQPQLGLASRWNFRQFCRTRAAGSNKLRPGRVDTICIHWLKVAPNVEHRSTALPRSWHMEIARSSVVLRHNLPAPGSNRFWRAIKPAIPKLNRVSPSFLVSVFSRCSTVTRLSQSNNVIFTFWIYLPLPPSLTN